MTIGHDERTRVSSRPVRLFSKVLDVMIALCVAFFAVLALALHFSPDSALVLSKVLLPLTQVLPALGITQHHNLMHGPWPREIYDVLGSAAVLFGAIGGALFAGQFVLRFEVVRHPAAFAQHVAAVAAARPGVSNAVQLRVALLLLAVITVPTFWAAVAGAMSFRVEDALVAFVLPTVVTAAGICVIAVPLGLLLLLATDAVKLVRHARSANHGRGKNRNV